MLRSTFAETRKGSLTFGDDFTLDAFYRGDARLLARVVEECMPVLERAVGRFVSGFDRDDVVQQTLTEVVEDESARRKFPGPDLSGLPGWLCTRARWRAIDLLKTRKRRKEHLVESPLELVQQTETVDEEQGIIERDEMNRLLADLQRFEAEVVPGLKAKHQEVFRLHYREHLDAPEIADRLGISRTSVLDIVNRVIFTAFYRFFRRGT